MHRVLVRLSALTFVLAACGGGGATTSSTTSTTLAPGPTVPQTTPTTAVVTVPLSEEPIVVWVQVPEVAEAVEERGVAYTASTGVEVEVHVFDAEALPEPAEGEEPITDMLGAVLAEVLDPAPDMVIGPHTWLLTLAEAGKAEPVTLLDGLPASIVRAVSLRDHAVGVPLAVNSVVQVRNRALMPDAPAEVEAIPCPDADQCLLLPGDGDADIHYPFLVAEGGFVFGGDEVDGFDREVVGVDRADAILGAAIFEALVTDGTVDTAVDRSAAIETFVSGDAALVWILGSDIAAVQSSGMDISIEPLPSIGGQPAIAPVRVLTAFIDTLSEEKSAARDFATEWLGDLNGSAAFSAAIGSPGVWSEVAGGALGVVLEAASTGRPVPYLPDIETVWARLATAWAQMHTGTSAETALGAAGAAIRP